MSEHDHRWDEWQSTPEVLPPEFAWLADDPTIRFCINAIDDEIHKHLLREQVEERFTYRELFSGVGA